MSEKRNKYDTDPLDPDFVRRTEEVMRDTSPQSEADPFADWARPATPVTPVTPVEEQTRRFDEQPGVSYPSVFVPPAYQPPQPQNYPTFGNTPPASSAPPPGPSSPYTPPYAPPPPQAPYARPSSRNVAGLGIPENIAQVLPYAPFYIGVIFSVVELLLVPRAEVRTRFHAAQALALHFVIIVGSILFRFIGNVTGSRFGGTLFGIAAFIFLLVSMYRVWHGQTHHLAPLDEPTQWLNQRIEPRK